MNILISLFENTLNKFIEKRNSKKIIYIVCSLVLVATTIPILYVSFYNVMCADDFSYAYSTHNLWVNDRSLAGIFRILSASFEQVRNTYSFWGGNYTSAFFSSIQPSMFNEKLTFLNTFIFLGFFLFSSFIFLKQIGTSYFKLQPQTTFLFYTIIVFFSVQFVPSAVESFYWFNGSFYNIMGWSFSLLLLTLLLKIKEKNKVRIFDLFLGVIFSIFIGGTSYSIIIALFLILFLLIIDIIKNKNISRRVKCSICFIVLIFIISSMISILAPGNQVRQAFCEKQNLIKTIIVSVFNGSTLISRYLNINILLSSLFVAPFIWRNINADKNKYKFPIVVIIISFLIFSASITPAMRAMGNIGPGRTQNIYWFLFIILYFLNFTYWIGWLKSNIQDIINCKINFNMQKKICFEIIIGILLLFTLKAHDKEATSYEAIREIISGEALQYKNQMDERNLLYYNPAIDNVHVDALIYTPYLLFFDDVNEDNTNWINISIAKYYNKTSVSINREKNN